MEKQSVLMRSMKMPRKEALLFVAVAAAILGLLFVDDFRRDFGRIGLIFTASFMLLVLVVGLLHLLPEEYLRYGIEVKEDGFIFHMQLRRTKYIRYAAIRRLVASSIIDGSGESTRRLRVESPDGNAWLDESILYRTTILDALKALPGFDHMAWSSSYVPEDSLLWAAISRKTVVCDKRKTV